MKVAVTYENGQVFQHFGQTKQFKIYDITDGGVGGSMVVDTHGAGHGALAGFLQALGIGTLICGGIGGGAVEALSLAGIAVYPGVTGQADQAAARLAEGNLSRSDTPTCDHHGESHPHGESHGCGHGHSCASRGSDTNPERCF